MKVFVTRQDIESGMPGEVEFCPVAIAVRTQMRSFDPENPVKVCVNNEGWIRIGQHCFYINPTEEVKMFVHDFDRGNDVDPFMFELHEG